jgi:hypothetical protein
MIIAIMFLSSQKLFLAILETRLEINASLEKNISLIKDEFCFLFEYVLGLGLNKGSKLGYLRDSCVRYWIIDS